MWKRARTYGLIGFVLFGNAACGFDRPVNGDADPPPGVGFQFPASLTDEAVGTHTVSIALAEPANDTVTVEVEVSGGSADSGDDFSLINPTVTFLAGETRVDVELTINQDGEEPDETIELKITHATNAVVIHDTHEVTISSDILPRVQFASESSSDPEDMPGVRSFTVTLDVVSPEVDVVVGVGLAGNASAADHDPIPTTLTVPAGQLSAGLVVPIVTDNIDEYDETLDLTLTAQAGAVLGASQTHIHTIVNDDPPPVVAFAQGASSQGEDQGSTSITVTLTPESGKPVSVDVAAIAGGTAAAGEYSLSSGTLDFSAGATSRTVQVIPIDDSVDEEDAETVLVALSGESNATLGTSLHTFSIVDDDPLPQLSFSTSGSTPAESIGSYTLTVNQNAVSARNVSFTVTASNGTANGADYSVGTGPYSIPAGMSSASVQVSVTNDSLDEASDTFTLSLGNFVNSAAGGTASHGGAIADDDVSVSFATASMSAGEGNGNGTIDYFYDVTLSQTLPAATTVDLVVSGTANGTDGSVSPSTTINFPANTPTQQIRVRVNRDNDNEGNDTFVMTLTGGPNAEAVSPTSRTHTITNDD